MTSSVVRPGPTGWRARIMFGSTSPSEYPWISFAKKSDSRSSLSMARSRKGIFLAANLTACSVCFSPPWMHHLLLVLDRQCSGFVVADHFRSGLRNSGAILLAQLAGNHARREEAPLQPLNPTFLPLPSLCCGLLSSVCVLISLIISFLTCIWSHGRHQFA